jgi:hypothetical protein
VLKYGFEEHAQPEPPRGEVPQLQTQKGA